MQSNTEDAVAGALPVADSGQPPMQEVSNAAMFDLGARQAEELRMLLLGFGTGLSIAVVFLVYVVLEAARALP